MIKSNLILFLIILTFAESFSQILPSYQGIYFKKKIIESNLILHLDASNSSSFDSNDLTVWNDLSNSDNDLNLVVGGVSFSSDNGGIINIIEIIPFCAMHHDVDDPKYPDTNFLAASTGNANCCRANYSGTSPCFSNQYLVNCFKTDS